VLGKTQVTFGLEADSLARHERFVTEALESEQVWGLRSEAGWANSRSNSSPGRVVMPFWSQRAGALRCACDGWEHYEPASVHLFEFMIAWLHGMEGAGELVGTNWNRQLIGHEIEPKALDTILLQGLPDDRFEAYMTQLDETG